MRRYTTIALAAILGSALLASTAAAQQRDYQRMPTGTAGLVSTDSGVSHARNESDLLRPYGSPGRGREEGWSSYRREPVAIPRERTHPAVKLQRFNYYPSLRPGQGPNRNYIPPNQLCVPGRRAVPL